MSDPVRPAFTAFYRARYRLLVRHVLYVGGSPHEAEDAAQAAMLAVYRRWELISDREAYAKRSAINEFLKARQRGQHTVCIDDLDREPAATGHSVEGEVISWITRDSLFRLLRELPEKQREVMAFIVDECTPAEIAELLGRTPAAIRRNLTVARERLRARHGEAPHEDG